MKVITRNERKIQINFSIGMANIDGGKPSAFTEKLLHQLKQAIIEEYTRTNANNIDY